jgi:regulator of sigma E protease
VSPFEAVAGAFRLTSYVVTTTVEGIGQIIIGKRSVKELGGAAQDRQIFGRAGEFGASRLSLVRRGDLH